MESTEQLMLFAADSHNHAKTSPLPASKQELKVKDQDYGRNSIELLAKYDPNTRLWKTSQHSLVAIGEDGLAEFSETWPRSGMMRNGIACQLPPLVPLTVETGFGLSPYWNTPQTMDSINHVRTGEALKKAMYRGDKDAPKPRMRSRVSTLREQVHYPQMWPTATQHGWRSMGHIKMMQEKVRNGELSSEDAEAMMGGSLTPARMFPTPQASDATKWNNMTREEREAKGQAPRLCNHLSTAENRVGGTLNPTWVEWLMGFPLGWTDLKDSETPSSHKSLKSSDEQS